MFKNIWQLFAGEYHQVVKITIPYPAPYVGLCLLSDSNEEFSENLGECNSMNEYVKE
jgi:hypothetical protein